MSATTGKSPSAHPFLYCVLLNISLWALLLGALLAPGQSMAQPAGGGWQQCATGNGEACNLTAAPDIRQLVTIRNNWNPGACVYGALEEQNATLVSPGQAFYYQLSSFDYCFATGVVHDGPATLVAYVRTLRAEPEPGEYQCTATVCPADSALLAWGCVLAWAMAWGVRRLLTYAADAEDY